MGQLYRVLVSKTPSSDIDQGGLVLIEHKIQQDVEKVVLKTMFNDDVYFVDYNQLNDLTCAMMLTTSVLISNTEYDQIVAKNNLFNRETGYLEQVIELNLTPNGEKEKVIQAGGFYQHNMGSGNLSVAFTQILEIWVR